MLLEFYNLNVYKTHAALWIIQLQTHQEHLHLTQGGGGHFLLFPAPHGGAFVTFYTLLKLIHPRGGGGGGVGIYFDWCIILLQQVKLIGRVSYTFILLVSLSSFYNNSYMFEAKF